MNLEQKFDTFRKKIEPTNHQRGQIRKYHGQIRKDIQKSSKSIYKTFLTGSYRKHTQIRPKQGIDILDVDIFAIIEGEGNWWNDLPPKKPQTYLKELKVCLKRLYPYSTTIQDKPCVTIRKETIDFEITPAFPHDTLWEKGYYIPKPGTENAWIWVKCPKTLGIELMKANKKSPLLIPSIKMMKAANRFRKKNSFKSFEIETKLISAFNWHYPTTYRNAIKQSL